MTEQERPRTDPAWLPDAVAYVREEFPMAVEAIEEAARTEGRQQAVRAALDYFLPFISRDFAGQDAQKRLDERLAAARTLSAMVSFDRVAGRNASESPPRIAECPHCGEQLSVPLGDASESPPTMTDANSEALAGPCPGGCGCRLYSPDADPKDCGCDSYCTMDTTDWPKWSADASESPHFHRRRVSEFSTAEYDAPCYLVHEGDASESPPMMLDVKDLRDAIIRVVGVEIDMVDAAEIAQRALADSIEAEAVGDASESPPPCPVCGSRTKDHDGFAHDAQAARYNTSGLFDPNGRPASESPPTCVCMNSGCRCAAGKPCGMCAGGDHYYGDASESGHE